MSVKARNPARKRKIIFTPHVDTGDFVIVEMPTEWLSGKRKNKKLYVFPDSSAATKQKLLVPAASGILNCWSSAQSAE